jgi:hypothetical protein
VTTTLATGSLGYVSAEYAVLDRSSWLAWYEGGGRVCAQANEYSTLVVSAAASSQLACRSLLSLIVKALPNEQSNYPSHEMSRDDERLFGDVHPIILFASEQDMSHMSSPKKPRSRTILWIPRFQ